MSDTEAVPRRWHMRRNCSLSPRATLVAYAVAAAMQSAIGGLFAAIGYPVVTLFCIVCLMALAAAWLHYARHAADFEAVVVDGAKVRVEQRCGTRVMRRDFERAWLHVSGPATDDGLVHLRARDGAAASVGQHLGDRQRPRFARELALAIQTSAA
jgi:uncharacterized membrane protein